VPRECWVFEIICAAGKGCALQAGGFIDLGKKAIQVGSTFSLHTDEKQYNRRHKEGDFLRQKFEQTSVV